MHGQAAQVDKPAGEHERAGDQGGGRAEAADQPSGGRGDGDHACRQRQERESGPQCGVSQYLLQIQGEEEEHRDHGAELQQRRDVGGCDAGQPEGAKRQQRRAGPGLVGDEDRKQRGRAGELRDRPRVAPSDIGCPGEAVNQQQQRPGD